ncbi:right-handed parallel beta-helix repeat-containing protein [Dinoroseobacter sp. S375]|uniref:right-handed parallel beta-helix repeat-containing protein n=1 Tax=Dinoroseobacter sp. S375 TaxID=3415136 RepID=UPI003C7976FA
MIVDTQLGLGRAVTKLSKEGGEIWLEPGSYHLERWKVGPETGLIHIRALRPDDPPTFSRIELKRSRNILFEGIRLRGGEASHDFRVIDGCEGITLRGADCRGTATGWVGRDDDTPNSFALVSDSSGIAVEDCHIRRYWQGAAFLRSSQCRFSVNRVEWMTADGLRMSDVHGMFISDNEFTRFFGSDQRVNHSDMIQIWAMPNPSSNVWIVGNNLDSQGEAATQSILILNEQFEKTGLKHNGIFIAANRVRNGHVNGIVVEHADGLHLMANVLEWDREAVMRYDSGPQNSEPRVRVKG